MSGLSPDQFQQLMYMQALGGGGGMGGNFSPTSSPMGAAGNAMSPLLRALMMQRMMGAQGPANYGSAAPGTPGVSASGNPVMSGYAAPMIPGQSIQGTGFVAPYGPSSQGFTGNGAAPPPYMSPLAQPPTPATPAVTPPTASGGIGGFDPQMGFGGLGY